MQTKIKKSDSEVWQLAKKLSRRKSIFWHPIRLLPNDTVEVYSMIRGNVWVYDLETLKLLDNRIVT